MKNEKWRMKNANDYSLFVFRFLAGGQWPVVGFNSKRTTEEVEDENQD